MGCVQALTDDILVEVLIRVPSPPDLASAAASCASFRRVISSLRFLCRLRSVHAPCPLGVFFPDTDEDTVAASFHRVVWTCLRSLRAPPPLGVFFPDADGDTAAFYPALSPNPSTPTARTLALAANFSFPFLPPPARAWLVRDHRNGRFLLDRVLTGSTEQRRGKFAVESARPAAAPAKLLAAAERRKGFMSDGWGILVRT